MKKKFKVLKDFLHKFKLQSTLKYSSDNSRFYLVYESNFTAKYLWVRSTIEILRSDKMEYLKSIFYFVLAGLFEIGGGYLIWLWLREGRGIEFAVLGAVILVLYGIIPTLQQANFGRGSIWWNIYIHGASMGMVGG